MIRDTIKRGLDLTLATAGLLALSPVLAGAAAAIAVSMGRPVLFRQRRPGRFGEPFTIYKFRTMVEPRPGESRLHSDGARVTALGQLLRKTSIDELPELWNVVRGDMSLVGPRPLLLEYLGKYTPEQMRRHEVAPGITGWAQVNGRQFIPFSKRLELDVWYVDNRSLGLDLRIVAKTLAQVVVGSGQHTGQRLADVDDLGFIDAPTHEPGE
ncbi:Lipid carrier : UDP-N-acetylgalactosaminyltransferase [Enhygromyxa salina]|uniref:Lipid carrier: UDP-N-acetylgalactosaminyltransferase n=1 Tax=Enhygromyxa salina TaxID=215803 RepID=A0A0C2D9C0_9BACT|nr:sugar transferase [Enhygromyxa salina]KIG19656.1 Lipid carrier : UDP-N-acetylgalactosaminyltransferase [Enhygromyxa salina]